MYQAAHYQFVASARVVTAAKKINPEFQIGCCLAATPNYPLTSDPRDQLLAQQEDNNQLYFTDVHSVDTTQKEFSMNGRKKGTRSM